MNDEYGELLLEYAELGDLDDFESIVDDIWAELDYDVMIDTILNYKEPELGETALMISTKKNNFPIVYYLLDNGANPNIKNNEGDTALMYAVSIPNNLDNRPNFRNIRMWNIAKLLLENGENGANPLIKNNEGKTAYDIVVDEGIINRVKDAELLRELKKYMRIHRIQALRRGNLTRRKLRTSMARRRLALSRFGDRHGLGEDVIQMLSHMSTPGRFDMTRPSHIDMIEETPYNM